MNNIHNIEQLYQMQESRDSVGFLRIMRQHSRSLHVTVRNRAGSSHYYMNSCL